MTSQASADPAMLIYRPGHKIFKEGEEGDSLYLIEEGEVEISRMVNGKKVVLHTLGAGGVFGEMALLNHTTRMATATAVKQTKLFLVPSFVLDQQMDSSGALVQKLVYALIENLRVIADRVNSETKT